MRTHGNEQRMRHNQTILSRPGVMQWCAITNERAIRFFVHDNITGETYGNMIINDDSPSFQYLKDCFTYQQNGGSPYFTNRVKAYLNELVPD